MHTNATPPVTAPAKAGGQSLASTAQNGSDSKQGQVNTMPSAHQTDAAVFVIGEREAPTPQQLHHLLSMIEESNRKIKESAAKWERYKPKPCAVPSTLGLSVNSAAAKLKRADLKVKKVVEEYNERVPEGHVISQVPGPGGSASKKAGVALIISKGPPPEKEKYDTIRQKQTVPILRIKSKAELESALRAHMRMGGQDPDIADNPLLEQDGALIF